MQRMSEVPALVLLHGFTNSGASWRPVISGLGQRYRAIAPDIRGHGSASDRSPVSLDAVIADIAELTAGPFMLAGYSQGGRIALHAALALHERVRRLLLISASPGLEDPHERISRRESDERLAQQIEVLPIEQVAAAWARTPVLGGVSAAVAAAAHEDRLRSTPTGLAAALRGLGTGALPSLWGRLHELNMPVTVIAGQRDGKFTMIAERMAALIPQAHVAIVPGAGHAVHLERPRAVAAELLAQLPADAHAAGSP